MHQHTMASIAPAFSSPTLCLHGAFGQSMTSRENVLMHTPANLLQLLISFVSLAPSVMSPPEYRNFVVCAYVWPAASRTSGGGGVVGGFPICGDFIGTGISSPKAPNTRTVAAITLTRQSGDFETPPASSVVSVLRTALAIRPRGVSVFPCPSPSPRRANKVLEDDVDLAASIDNYLKRLIEQHIERQRRQHASFPQSLSNLEGYQELPVVMRTQASTPSWSWRMCPRIFSSLLRVRTEVILVRVALFIMTRHDKPDSFSLNYVE